ncbi:MAG: response regulator, partial [Nitrospirota bacterium]|nr:response regulator [Nitrospirota bacterium]
MIGIPPTASSSDLDLSGKSFLIIDDFYEIRNVFSDILRKCGVRGRNIHVVANGNEAISSLKKKQYDVVLCDLNLGAGKNGQQVLEEAKLHSLVGPNCIWIMTTADKTAEAVTGAAQYQPDSYLIKPINETILHMRLEKIWAKKNAFAEIHEAMGKKDYQKAIKLCDKRLDFDIVNNAELQRTKCDLLLRCGELDRASEQLDEILAERDYSWAMTGKARILMSNGDFSAAKVLLEDTLKENPSFLEAHDLLVETFQSLGDLAGAYNALERAVALSPNSVVRQKNLGEIALKLGNLEKADKAFRKSVSLGENSVLKNADAYIGLAKTCTSNSNHEEALIVLGELNKNFNDKDIHLKAIAVEGTIQHQCGNTERAKLIAREFSELVKNDEIGLDSERSLEVARLLMATGDQESAISMLKQEIKNNPENNTFLIDATEILCDAG